MSTIRFNRWLVVCALLLCVTQARAQADPLPSWNDDTNKRAIVDFVSRVTKTGHSDFVPAAQRIATFDNDGTLWSEQPIYFQFAFARDRVKALSSKRSYDRESQIGRLNKALDEAIARKWIVVDMKRDWKVIYRVR